MTILLSNEKAYYERYHLSLMGEGQNETLDETDYDVLYRERLTKKDFSGNIPKDVRFLFILGVGSKEGICSILLNINPLTKVLIYEPDRRYFEYVCCKEDFSEFFKNKQIEIVFGTDNIEEDIRHYVYEAKKLLVLKHMFIVYYPGYERFYPAKMEEMKEAVRNIVMRVAMEYETVIPNQREIYKNQLYALSVLQFSSLSSKLFDKLNDKKTPIMIVGAGPSLEKNISYIKKAEGKAFIIACTRATEVLKKYGIKIDLVVMLDYAQGYDYCSHDVEREYTMLFHAQAAADIQKAYRGHGIYFGFDKSKFPFLCLKDEIDGFAKGGSVITCVFSFLIQAGYMEYILVGEDLAFSESGRTHSGNRQEDTNEKCYYVDGIHGGKVRTRADWKVFLEFFENMIAIHPHIHVTDATEGGALIHGTEVCTLEQAISRLENKPYLPIGELWEELPRVEGVEDIQQYFQNLEKACSETQVLLSDAIMWNEMACDQIRRGISDLKEFQQIADSYETLYHRITEGEGLLFLQEYCTDIFYQYMEEAQYLNTQEQIVDRMQLERKLFIRLRMECSELRIYLQELKKNRDFEA